MLIAPAHMTTSFVAAARKRAESSGPRASSIPTARGFESDVNRIRVAVDWMRTCRFGRERVSLSRKAVADELPGLYYVCHLPENGAK